MSISAQAYRMIEAKRKQDQNYREMDAVRAATEKTLQIANFEISTSHKIEKRVKQKALERMKLSYEEALLERRRQLAELYNREMEEWKAEALSKVETQEDRKARIMERAYALRDAREKAHREFVQKCYDEQWRDACDDARLLDSKALTVEMSREVVAQIEEKQRLQQQLSQQEAEFVEEWRRKIEADGAKQDEKDRNRQRADREMQEGIRQQIQQNTKLKKEHLKNVRQEEEGELSRLRLEMQADEEDRLRRRQNEIDRGFDVKRFNEENKHLRHEKREVEKTQDAILLEHALRKEAEANALEERKRAQNRAAATEYRRYLEEQMVKEAEDSAFMDEVCRREEERVWKARDDALQAREEARALLMQMVDEGRQQQIQEKQKVETLEKEDGKKFAARFLEEAKEGVEKERQEAVRRRQHNMDNKEQLSQQIQYRRHKEELEKQEAYLADKHMQYKERLHQQRLAEQGGAVRSNFPLKSGQWYS